MSTNLETSIAKAMEALNLNPGNYFDLKFIATENGLKIRNNISKVALIELLNSNVEKFGEPEEVTGSIELVETEEIETAAEPQPQLCLPPATPVAKHGDSRRYGCIQPQMDFSKKSRKEIREQVYALLGMSSAPQVAKWAKEKGLKNIDLCYKSHWATVLEFAQSLQQQQVEVA